MILQDECSRKASKIFEQFKSMNCATSSNDYTWDVNDNTLPKVRTCTCFFFVLFLDLLRTRVNVMPAGHYSRGLPGLAKRTLQARVQCELRGGAQARQQLGHAEHQQPQRRHPQEELSRRARLQRALRSGSGRSRAPAPGNLRQGPEETIRSVKNLLEPVHVHVYQS